MAKIIFSVTNDIVTDQRVYKISHTLEGAGNEVMIVGREHPDSPKINKDSVFSKRFKLLFQKGPLFYMEYNLRLLMYLLVRKADIFVADDLDTLPANFLAARLRRKILVYDSHEYFTEVPELIGRSFVRSVWIFIEKRILPGIKVSYTVCESLAKIYNEKYGIQMQVVRNLPLCNRQNSECLESLHRDNERIILYQGALNRGRGLESAIQAMRHVNNARLVIIGGGNIEKDLHLLVKKEKLDGKINFIGRKLWEELYGYTRQADLGISLEEKMGLNYYYALPNKLFDYIHAGVPVLVSDFPEMRKIVDHYEIGNAITYNTPQELAAFITEILDNKNLIRKWKKNLEIAGSELCWEKEEKKIMDIYSGIIRQVSSHNA